MGLVQQFGLESWSERGRGRGFEAAFRGRFGAALPVDLRRYAAAPDLSRELAVAHSAQVVFPDELRRWSDDEAGEVILRDLRASSHSQAVRAP